MLSYFVQYKKYVSLRPKHCTTTAYLWINLKLVTYMLTYPSEGIGLHCTSVFYGQEHDGGCQYRRCIRSYTNHSCRKTTGSRLHNAGFTEADIQSVTGHSSNSVREYISIEDERKREMSEKLSISNACSKQNMKENSIKPTMRLSKNDIVVELFLD